MRRLWCCFFLVVMGCGQPVPRGQAADAGKKDQPPAGSADLRTRKTGSDWPAFLGPLGTGVSPEKGILAPWPKEGLRLVWQMSVDTGYAMPSISRGRLFHFDRHEDKACLRCFRSETGEFLWKFEYPTDYEDRYNYANGPRCCPVIDDDRVYILGPEGVLHCLKTTDGKLLWKVDTKKDFGVVQNFFGVGSTPVIEKDLLIVQVGGSPPTEETSPSPQLKGNKSGVVAFDKLTGKVRYRITDELASYAGPVLATIGSRRWCFVLARGGLIGFEPASGKVDFHFPWRATTLESVNAANPVVVGDRVFLSECYGPGSALVKVQSGGCEEVWSDADKRFRKSMQCHWATPIHHDGYVYGCSGRNSRDAELRCVELATGKVMWSEPDLLRCSLLMVDGHFICLSEDGLVTLLKVNPRKYEEVSRLDLRPKRRDDEQALLKYPCWAAPILAHGLLYLRGNDKLICLELIAQKR